MFRTRFPAAFLFAPAATGASTSSSSSSAPLPQVPTNIQYDNLTEINSAYQLLRLLLRSAELKIKSRQGRQFMKRRIVTQWRLHRTETDPVKQRALMERAGAVLHAMHIKGRAPRPDEPFTLDFTSTRHSAGKKDG